MIGSLATREDPPKIPFGLDGLHAKLDGQLLATLGTTTGEDGAAALGGHASTEAVSLGTLALVGLIRTLHDESLLGVVKLQRNRVKPQDCSGDVAFLSNEWQHLKKDIPALMGLSSLLLNRSGRDEITWCHERAVGLCFTVINNSHPRGPGTRRMGAVKYG